MLNKEGAKSFQHENVFGAVVVHRSPVIPYLLTTFKVG